MELHGRSAVNRRRPRGRALRRRDDRDRDGSDRDGDNGEPLEPAAPAATALGCTAAFGAVEAQDEDDVATELRAT
jgi:hypothetical protein